MSRSQLLSIAILLIFANLVGCAIQPSSQPASETYSHTPYQQQGDIVDKVVINKPFEQTWNDLVRNLAENFFSIDQIDKESRFISINASQDAGGIGRNQDWWLNYASCGTSERKIIFEGNEQTFTYATIGSEPYSTAFSNTYHYWDEVRPRVDAEIKMNIYLSPIDATHTEMSVNARYKFVRYLNGKRYTRRNSGQYLFESNIVDNRGTLITFTSQNPGQHPSAVIPPIMCYSSGEFESAVIKLAQ